MTSDEFRKLYDPRNFYNYTTNEERCHHGSAPTLRECVRLYGRKVVADVMLPYLDMFFGFLSASRTPSPSQRQTIVWLTIQNYGGLKVSEWLLFFTKAMAGQFGKFYNNVDTLDIMTAIREWATYCYNIRQARKAREIEESNARAREWQPISDEDRNAAIDKIAEIAARLKGGR